MSELGKAWVIQIAHVDVPTQDGDQEDQSLPVVIVNEQTADSSSSDVSEEALVDAYYLRILCRMPKFLCRDSQNIRERGSSPIKQHPNQSWQHLHNDHRFLLVQHPKLTCSAFYFNPREDCLWLSQEIDSDWVKDMRGFYGDQLDLIEYIVVEQNGIWASLESALEVMEHFKGIRIVYVWLESYRFINGEVMTKPDGYAAQAGDLMDRDKGGIKGQNWMIKYIDHDLNV